MRFKLANTSEVHFVTFDSWSYFYGNKRSGKTFDKAISRIPFLDYLHPTPVFRERFTVKYLNGVISSSYIRIRRDFFHKSFCFLFPP